MVQLSLTCDKTFLHYAINTFVPYVSSILTQVEQVVLVWDRYFAESVKNWTREKLKG